MASDLAAVLVPIGYVGAALAVICAIVAAVAIIRGKAGLTGGAVGLWIVCALMSFTASFATEWRPLIVAGAALVAMLAIGGVVRAIVSAAGDGRADRTGEDALPKAVPASKPEFVSVSKPGLSTKTAATSSIPVVS